MAPHFIRNLDDQSKLRKLLVFSQSVAFLRTGEAALGAKREPVEIDVLGGLIDAALEQVLGCEMGKPTLALGQPRMVGRDFASAERRIAWGRRFYEILFCVCPQQHRFPVITRQKMNLAAN